MRGKPTPKEIRKEVKRLYCSGYPLDIIALRTQVAVATIKRWASLEKWHAQLKPLVTLDDILEDYRTILAHTRGRLLELTLRNEFEDEYDRLVDKSRQLVFITESLMKQSPYDSAKQAEEIFEKAKNILPSLRYTDEERELILDGLEAIQEHLYGIVCNTIQKLS